MMFHKSVLLKESIEALSVRPEGIYVDATYGGGGHSREILKHLKEGKLFVFDQDSNALKNTIQDLKITMINSNFRYARNFLKLYKAVPVDGILADTEGIEPTSHVVPMARDLRADEPTVFPWPEQLVEAAPRHEDGYFRVPRIID